MQNGNSVDVVFFDARDTLGEVDRPGHLVPYRPTSQALLSAMKDAVGLRIGIITNLPKEVSAEQGREMVREAILAEDGDGSTAKIGDFLDADGLIINHDAGFDKPDPRIFRYAAERMGVPVERCIFCGENLIEVLGARAAGMQAQLKPCPPGREFLAEPIEGLRPTATSSGRAFEMMLEHEHLLGDRIFHCMSVIAERLRAVGEGERIPAEVHSAMGMVVYLTENFADQTHLRAEELVVPLAVARGMDPGFATWMFDHHDQARAYFQGLDVAWRRINRGDDRDLPYATADFALNCEGFVKLFEFHAVLENDELYPEIGRHLSDADDTIALNIVQHTGPPDITPYASLVAAMEQALGIGAA
jgi:hemerythrin-like domain-containing protein